MKSLHNYTQDAQTELFNKFGAFFAFSNKQFDERKLNLVSYESLGSGLVAPKGTAEQIMEGLEGINAAGIAADIAENGKEAIIQRELANYECQITMDYSDVIEALEDYDGITEQDISAGYTKFMAQCIRDDNF